MPTLNPEVYGAAAPHDLPDPETLPEGVRDLTMALNRAGLITTDSGDGSNYSAGMECALPYHHVFVACTLDRQRECAHAMHAVLAAEPGLIDWPFVVSPLDSPEEADPEIFGVVAVLHRGHEALAEVAGLVQRGVHWVVEDDEGGDVVVASRSEGMEAMASWTGEDCYVDSCDEPEFTLTRRVDIARVTMLADGSWQTTEIKPAATLDQVTLERDAYALALAQLVVDAGLDPALVGETITDARGWRRELRAMAYGAQNLLATDNAVEAYRAALANAGICEDITPIQLATEAHFQRLRIVALQAKNERLTARVCELQGSGEEPAQ